MTIYLYKKTHNKTGLQYLGKTKANDPYKYKGSGIRWSNHIKMHGYDVTTEILRECQSNEEVKEWGRYYSDLWNVVESSDWANLKPEEGDGGQISAESNEKRKASIKQRFTEPFFREKHKTATRNAVSKPETKNRHRAAMKSWANDPAVQQRRKLTLQTKECKQKRALTEQLPETKVRRKLAQKISQNKPEVKKKLSGPNNYRYDHTIYEFMHESGSVECCTRRELINKYQLDTSRVSLLIQGKAKSHKGWRLLPTL